MDEAGTITPADIAGRRETGMDVYVEAYERYAADHPGAPAYPGAATAGEDALLADDMERANRAPVEVRSSEFGCRNCLWSGVECCHGERYAPRTVTSGRRRHPSCGGYNYYD